MLPTDVLEGPAIEAVVNNLVNTNKLLMERPANQSTTMDTHLTQLSEQDKEIGKANKSLTVQHPREVKCHDAGAHQTDETRLTYAGATATGDVES